MSKRALALLIGRRNNISYAQAKAMINIVADGIGQSLLSGESVSINGWGRFCVIEKGQRIGRHPQTGESIIIPATKKACFIQSKSLKDKINNV